MSVKNATFQPHYEGFIGIAKLITIKNKNTIVLIQKNVVTLPPKNKTKKFKDMMFNERIKQLREESQIPQRKLAAAMDIDTASYCKIEHGNRRAKREHIPIIAELLQADTEELITLWLAEQVYFVVKDEKHADKALNIVAKKL